MADNQSEHPEKGEASALDVEFLPICLIHKVHRNLKSSQVEIVTEPHYFREPTPEPEPEMPGEAEPEVVPPTVVYAPPLPEFREKKNWWDFHNPVYAFNNPRIRSRIELLMISRIVNVADRKYMVKLQEKIKDDYTARLKRRMLTREAEEIEREKTLLLEGKISFENAPLELKNHPICRINQLAQKIIKHKKAKMKIPDKTWAYRTPLKRIKMMEKVMRESMSEKESERNLESSQVLHSVCVVDADSIEDIERGFMFSKEDFNTLKMEDPLIKLLREIDAVNDLYDLADQIIGPTKVFAKEVILSMKSTMVKKPVKVVQRWQPLPEDASTMQVMIVPEVDEYRFNPDEMTKEELKNLSVFIDQSNKTLEVENMIIERYLKRMDPNALGKMNQILEAAAIASQKAERAAMLGGGPSVLSMNKDMGSRTTDESSEDTSRSSTTRSGSTRGPKLGLFGLSDKGPKIQPAQKIEIVNREIDELKNVLETFREKARKKNYVLRCRNEELSERFHEISDAQHHFENKLLVEGLDPMTGKLSGEKFLRYLEMRLKSEEMEIDKMRVKTGSLKAYLKKVMLQLAQKEELGGALHAVDFEQLQIENRECQELLEEKALNVNHVKRINGKFGNLLNVHKKRLNEQVSALAELNQITVVKDKMIEKLMADEAKVNSEVDTASRALEKITKLMKSFTVPDVMDYILKKAEIHDLKNQVKVRQRKMNIKELVLAGQQQKMRCLSTVISSKHLGFSSNSRDSRIFF